MAKPLTAKDGTPSAASAIDREALRRFVSRAAAVMLEQKNLGEDLKEICAECDEAGVASKKEIRKLARETLMDKDILEAQLERMDFLRRALGQLADTPLGVAATAQPARRQPRQTEADIGEPVGAGVGWMEAEFAARCFDG